MAERKEKFCIFCGNAPEDKNKEHPLPVWLLTMTGDPNRVVVHGHRWSTGERLAFSFDQLHFPACSACNTRYSILEGQAKKVVEAICKKEAISPASYVVLLDWLDKVRVGLWLGYRYLQQNPYPVNFTIDSRLGMKDRMVAVYTIGDHQTGLNHWGPETRLFQWKPSVFALRVNNILFLNASWDFMCSARCGYPFPRTVRFSREHGGMLVMSDFHSRRKVIHPIMPGLMKSCVTLFQPTLQLDHGGSLVGRSQEDIEYHLQHAWPGRNGLGPLFRQFTGKTVEISEDHEFLEFDSVLDREANRAIDIASQAYSLQNHSVRADPVLFDDGSAFYDGGLKATCIRENARYMHHLRNRDQDAHMTQAQQLLDSLNEKRIKKRKKGMADQ